MLYHFGDSNVTTVKPAPKRRGRPPSNPKATKKPASTTKPADDDYEDLIGPSSTEELSLDIGAVYGGVSANWLCHVFGMDRVTVKKRLAEGKCQVAGKNKGTPLYLIKDAAAWLVKPQVDLTKYIQGLRPNDLPPILNAAYWDAMLKRQKWEENAGDLWRTKDVIDVLGNLATTLKSTIQLWPEQVSGLSDKQRLELEQRAAGLLDSIHHILVTAPDRSRSVSSAEEPGELDVSDD